MAIGLQGFIKAVLYIVVIAQIVSVFALLHHLRAINNDALPSPATLEMLQQLEQLERELGKYKLNYTNLITGIDQRRVQLVAEQDANEAKLVELLDHANSIIQGPTTKQQQDLQTRSTVPAILAKLSSNTPIGKVPSTAPTTTTTTATATTNKPKEAWDTDQVVMVEDVEWLYEKPLDVSQEHLWRYKSSGLYWTRQDRLYRKFVVCQDQPLSTYQYQQLASRKKNLSGMVYALTKRYLQQQHYNKTITLPPASVNQKSDEICNAIGSGKLCDMFRKVHQNTYQVLCNQSSHMQSSHMQSSHMQSSHMQSSHMHM
jgi:hypothetical protein